jgi:transposase
VALAALAPDKKGALRQRATLVFVDESGFSERPSIRRTWAKKGATPILKLPFNWKRLSAIGALSATPGGRRVRLFLSLRPGSVKSLIAIEFLRNLRRHLPGRVILLWDRLAAHRSKLTQDFIHSMSSWLTAEFLPPYAPELNPVEPLWSYLSATQLANYSPDGLADLAKQVRAGTRRLRRQHDNGRCFLKHSGLF